MAKEKSQEKSSQREELWAKFLESYKAKNPVKFAQKEAAGEFKTIPASFRGEIVEKFVLKNGQRVGIEVIS